MKIIGPAIEDDLPDGFVAALHEDPGQVFYCMDCDGLRVRGHECDPPFRGWKHADGTPYTEDEEWGR